MNRELFLAVLAMDSYNRGYDFGIGGLSDNLGTQIGSAVVVASANNLAAVNASFYAVAYLWNGETIISYRGTDGFGDAGADLSIGLGNPNSQQAFLAADFYRSVTSSQDPYAANATLVGHSLGGGLAGLIGGIYGKEAAIFDNMAFRSATNSINNVAYTIRQHPDQALGLIDLYGNLDSGFYNNITIEDVNFSQIHGWKVSGQFLSLQSEGTPVGDGLGLTDYFDLFQLHSMSLLVTLMYATDVSNVPLELWKSIAKPLIAQLFSDEIAAAASIPAAGVGGVSSAADKMRDMIAYSVIDDGAMPFGNTAIKTMFDDANNIAAIFGSESASLVANTNTSLNALQLSFENSLSEIIVQHAAQLANGHVVENGDADKSAVVHVEGSYDAISVDTASAAWVGGNQMVGWNDLKNDVKGLLSLSGTALTGDANTILDGADFVVFGQSGPIKFDTVKDMLNDGYHLSDAAQASALIIGTTETDNIIGGKNADFIVTGGGNDVLVGGDGKDALYGGDGTDIIILGNIDGQNGTVNTNPFQSEVVNGGAGADYIVISAAKGTTVTVSGGDAEDHLLIHNSVLKGEIYSGGDIKLFQFLGGVFYSTPVVSEYTIDHVPDATANVFEDDDGATYKEYIYADKPFRAAVFSNGFADPTYNGWNSTGVYTDATVPYEIIYKWFDGDHHLDIEIYAEYNAGTDTRAINETITISNFSNGDYGIHFGNVYLPYAQTGVVDGQVFHPDSALNAYAGSYNSTALDAAIKDLSDRSFEISLTSDGVATGSQRLAITTAGTTPMITADNLIIAIDGGIGDDHLKGLGVTERIHGGGGSDILDGDGGNDRYTYSRGDGNDTINETMALGGTDRLVFSDIISNEVSLLRNGNDITIVIAESTPGAGDASSILLTSSYEEGTQLGVEEIKFSDGTIWMRTDIRNILALPVNHAPVVAIPLIDQSFAEDSGVIFTLPTNSFTDTDNNSLSYAATLASGATLPSWLSFNAVTQTFTGTPPTNFNGSFDVKVAASDGSLTASDTLTLVITPVNDAPVAINDGPISLLYNTPLIVPAATLLANDTDVDGDNLTVTAITNPAHGTISMLPNGDISFVPAADYIGPASFSYTVSDSGGGSATATVSVSVHGVVGQVITGTAVNNVLTGTGGDDTIYGLAGNDTLSGAGGVDTLIGGSGNDTYVVDSVGDVTTELLNEGTDAVQASLSWTLASNVENLTLTGSANLNGTGNALVNVITGNGGNNTLNGGGGIDTLKGGLGDDTYVVDVAGIVTTEAASGGTDTVLSSISWTLASNVENLNLTSNSAISGTGNTLANFIIGNGADNALNGGTGADTLIGGLGNDTYVVDNIGDITTENSGEGIDVVQSSITWALAVNIENLTLTGTASINGTGNALDNIIIGNIGNNILNGGLGADTLIGNMGNDTYVVDNLGDITTEVAGAGTDFVLSAINWTLVSDIENLTLTGSANINGTGNALVNVITGNGGNNTLNGGGGIDTLKGGLGDDTYVVDVAGVITTEAASAGVDAVVSSISWTLATNVENLSLSGSGTINGTGNTLANLIIGNGADNILSGGSGADTLVGDFGNDTYVVDNLGDITTEGAGAGTDLVQSSITWTLASNIENLALTGTANIGGTGNTLDNILTGNGGNNILNSGIGADTLIGGAGNDTLTGGLGNDTFNFATGFGKDTITDFTAGAGATDLISLSLGAAFDTYAEVISAATQIGANTVITVSAIDTITLTGVLKTALVMDGFLFV